MQDLAVTVKSLQSSVTGLSEQAKGDRDVVGTMEARLAELERRLDALDGGGCDEKLLALEEKGPEPVENADEEAVLLEHTLGETLWDAPALIGLPELGGFCSSTMLLLSMLLNALVQIYITWVLVNSESFISTGVWKDMGESVGRWRTNEAHESSAVDAAGVSLASRVCGQDDSLQVAGAQTNTLAEINAYLGLASYELQTTSLGTGPLLCSVCILLFAVLVLKDLRSTCSSLLAVFALPRGHTRVEDGRLAAVSRPRLAFFLALQLLRVLVSAALLYTGVMWLSYTSSITDLILNAAALGFVMDLDELLFETTVPGLVQKFVAGLAPVKYRKPPCYMEAVLPLLMLVAIVATSVAVLILPQIDDMLAVKDVMCAGNLDFAIQRNGVGFVAGKATVAFDPDAGAVDTIEIKAVKELKSLDLAQPGLIVQYAQPSINEQNFVRDSTMTIAQMAAQSYCEDMDTFNGGVAVREFPVWFMTVRHETGINRGSTHAEVPWRCADYARFCGAMALLRNICPITCGCTRPRSGLLISQSVMGCPASCEPIRAQALLNESCADRNVAGTPEWTNYWRSYRMVMTTLFPQLGSSYDAFISSKIALGCSDTAPDPTAGHDFCSGDAPLVKANGMGTIRGFCPALCCSGPNPSPKCPRACSR